MEFSVKIESKGIIENILVEEGEQVLAGKVLATLAP